MTLRIVLALVFAGVVVGGIVFFNMFRDNMIEGIFAEMQPPPVTVSVTTAEVGTWEPGLEAIGTARARRGVELAVEAGGVVEDILFEANQRVEQGALLVQIDDEVEAADLAAAQSSLDLSQTQLERAETLLTRGVTANNEVDVAQADESSARSQVVRLTAIMDQKALEAPFSGIVGIPQVDIGEYVVPGTVYATLQDLDRMRVDFSVPEQQIRLLANGLPVEVTSEIGTTRLTGRINAIEPRIDPNTRLVTVRAEVENPNGEINPGQFLRVRVVLPAEEGVIALPQTAISSSLYGDTVYVVREDPEAEPANEGDPPALTVEEVFVEIGRRSESRVEVIEGVEAGERVVTAGQNRLSGGARVVIDNTVDPTRSAAAEAAAVGE